MRHRDGEGWVDQSLGDYADALSRRTKVCLVLVESLGGIYHATKRQLHTLSKRASGTHRLWIVHDMAEHPQVHGRTCSITLNDFLVLRAWVMLTRSTRGLQ
jgi:hypothetical protein